MRWDGFREACPRIAALAEERFRRDGLAILGTIRPDGAPRLSACEVDLAADRLLFGMMWRSRKALDLLRDPRLSVMSVPSDRDNAGGDVKLSGLAIDERDPEVREAFRKAILERIDWAPDEPTFHLFSLEVGRASYIRFGDDRLALAWDPVSGCREVPHPDAG
jgi:pyridoxamine 5'-phosphate oxidase-like protein